MEYVVEGDTLVIRLPIGAAAFNSAPLSSTGKTRLVCNNAASPIVVNTPHGTVKVGINATTPNR